MRYRNDSWAGFRGRILDHKLLSERETRELIKRYKETRDVRYANQVALHNMRFVFNVARRYVRPSDPKIWELVGEGFAGMRKAIIEFDLDKNLMFITYAVWWVRQHILQYLETTQHVIPVPAEQQRRAKRKSLAALPADAPEHKLVKRHGLKAYKIKTTPQIYTLDAPDPRTDYSSSFMDTLPASADYIPDSGNALLPEMFSQLSEREVDIVSRYYGLGMAEPDTLVQLGERYGLSKERVRQLKEKAVAKLRGHVKRQNMKFHDLDFAAEFTS